MARKHILWGIAAPLSIVLFIVLAALPGETGALRRIIAYLVALGGASALLVSYAAMKDNRVPRIVCWCYLCALAVCIVGMFIWLFSPLWEAPTALGWGLIGLEAYAVGCFISGALSVTAYFIAPRA